MQKEDKKPQGQAEEGVESNRKADNSAAGQENTDEKAQKNDSPEGSQRSTLEELEKKNTELNDKYLRLYSEYDNYRRRTVREKADIIKAGGEDVFKTFLPVIDDFERAIKANEDATDLTVVTEGMKLIYNKFKAAMQQRGLQAFETKGKPFDPDVMEAITHIPAGDEHPAGTVVDEVEKGYRLGDKVIRYAKVVVAQ